MPRSLTIGAGWRSSARNARADLNGARPPYGAYQALLVGRVTQTAMSVRRFDKLESAEVEVSLIGRVSDSR
jgi:hypothetical protein